MARRTRRTNNEISTFIMAWLDSASTREVAHALARNRKNWPYSIEVTSLSQFASQLRAAGVELPSMDTRGHRIDASYFNEQIHCHMS